MEDKVQTLVKTWGLINLLGCSGGEGTSVLLKVV